MGRRSRAGSKRETGEGGVSHVDGSMWADKSLSFPVSCTHHRSLPALREDHRIHLVPNHNATVLPHIDSTFNLLAIVFFYRYNVIMFLTRRATAAALLSKNSKETAVQS